jgi:uncharacterized small protein (DUF1192 family)
MDNNNIVVGFGITSGILFLAFLAYIVRVKLRRRKEIHAAEIPSPSTITRDPDVERQSRGLMEQPPTGIGEVYTLEGPGRKVRLAYNQKLPRHILNVQGGTSNMLSSGGPAPTNGTSGNTGDPRAAPSPSAQEQLAVLTPDETTAAILALQQEVQRLRTQGSQSMIPRSQDEDPFNPPPIVREGMNAPPGSTSQERVLRTQLEVLRLEVERLQAENAVLVLADPSSPPAYRRE